MNFIERNRSGMSAWLSRFRKFKRSFSDVVIIKPVSGEVNEIRPTEFDIPQIRRKLRDLFAADFYIV